MKLSEAGLTLLKVSEGFRGHVYRDIAGFRTIGYGHRLHPDEDFPGGITMTEGDAILAEDVATAEAAVERLVKVGLEQGQFDALVDFVFNLGEGRLAASTLLRYLNGGNHEAAGLELQYWDHSGHIQVAALTKRRAAEYQLWKEEA